MRPAQMVAWTRPSMDAPSKGVFFDFERESFAAKFHCAAGSKTTTSAMLPTASEPVPAKETIAAGAVLISEIILLNDNP